MTSKRSRAQASSVLSEQDEALETYDFIPGHLRHHFKADLEALLSEDSNRVEQERVRHARQTRSAYVVANSFSLQPPTQLLYSNAIERAITARMTFSRALQGLEKYFRDVMAKMEQLEIQHPDGVVDASGVKIPTLMQTQRQIVNVCQGCLNDCDLYLGMYEALPSPPTASSTPIVRYVACSPKSSMLHQRLECPFPAVGDPKQPQSGDNQTRPMCITMQAMAAKDVIIVDDVAELEQNEIRRFSPNEASTGPFSCFPLVSGQTAEDTAVIGVLSVDSCRKAHRLLPQSMSVEGLYAFLLRMQLKDAAMELRKAKMDGACFLALTEIDIRHKPSFQRLKVATRNKLLEIICALQRGSRMHLSEGNERALPFTKDDDALEFLDGVSKLSGEFLGHYRRVHWIQEIANSTMNQACTAYDVYDVLIRAITRSLESLERVAVWKITQKKVDATAAPAASFSPWEIDVVASTSVPDDRLVPFLDAHELKMRRLALCKENEEAIRASRETGANGYTTLLRGGITSVTSEPESSTTSRSYSCEHATYHVSWADRSLQTLSWTQLRQLLPIRTMNAKHFELRQLCQKLQDEANEPKTQHSERRRGKIIRINSPNGVVIVLRDASRPPAVNYVLEVDFTAHFEPPQVFYDFIERAIIVAEQALTCVRGREARQALRKRAVARNTQRFQSIGLNPSGDALRALQDIVHGVFADIVESLPGVHVQIAELQADGAQLQYTFASSASTILGCTLNRGQGVSFKCLDAKQTVVVGATSKLRPLLLRLGALRSQRQAIDDAFPFVFVPLFHEDCCVGVLSVDSFQTVPKGRQDEAHPEAGVLEFLVLLGKLLARAIYAKRRSYALHEIQLACQEPLRSPQQLLFYACRALKDVMVGAWKVRVVEIDGLRGKTTLVYELSEGEREQARSWLFNVVRPMAFRWKELCTDTIENYSSQLQNSREQGADGVIKLLAAIREDEEERQKSVERYEQLIAEEQASLCNAPRRSAVAMEKAKLLERQVADKYFFLLDEAGDNSPMLTEELAPGDDRLSSQKYIAHALKLFLGTSTCLYSELQAMGRTTTKVFLTVTALPQFHASCDQTYLQRVTSVTSKSMAALGSRIRRSKERTDALNVFRDLCQRALTCDDGPFTDMATNTRAGRHSSSPTEEVETECLLQLQRDAIALIERTLNSPNVYFGMWEPALRILRYTSASNSSMMAGKKLKHGYGVSFQSLEKQIPIVVSSRDAANDNETASNFKKLRFFTTELMEDRKWPFIVVPVGNLGVLSLDNMHNYEQEANELQPELGVVDFLRKIGQSFAEVLTVIRGRTILRRQHLRDVALLRVMTACENFKPTASNTGTVSLYLPHLIIQQIEDALNGVDAYIGLVDPLCERIRFICASSKSKMERNTVDTAQSLSFRVFSSQRSIVIPQLAQYFKEQEISQQHGSEPGQKLKYFGGSRTPQGPFVCVPIPFVGVLSVDTFPGAAGGVFSPKFPEDGVVAFLEKIANYLGENIRTLAANEAGNILPTLFRGNRSTVQLLFQEILAIISRNLVAVFDMKAFWYERDKQSGQWRRKGLLASMQRSTSRSHEPINAEEEQRVMQNLEDRYKQKDYSRGVGSGNLEIVLPPVHQLSRDPEVLVVHCASARDVGDDDAALVPTVLLLRRVRGATWMYDEDFLLSVLPLINSLIELVNVRAEGIVARRLATRQISDLCRTLESLPSAEATQVMYRTMLPTAMETIAQAMSRNNCDVYIGQRELSGRTKSQVSELQLRFVAASSRSLMRDVAIDLENVDNSSLTVVQCLQNQKFAEVSLTRESSPVRALTSKSALRVYLAAPMGDNYVLCADSLGEEAFVPGKRQVEPDIIAFIKAAASKLHETILSTRHRLSYDQLRSLTRRPHTDLKLFHSTILGGLRRDLVDIHSQQILTLGADFTSSFRLDAWQRSSTRRLLKTLPEHYCSVNGCEKMMIAHEIHSESHVFLPMSNVPRTLDMSRSCMQPVEGTEKHGTFTCACLATMLDSSVAGRSGDAKLALCIFSHDATSTQERGELRLGRRSMIPRDYGDSTAFFTSYQRQYFFAFAAVASDVYTHVFRACALETFAAELFMVLQEYLDAKDGIVARFSEDDDSKKADDAQILATDDDGCGSTALAGSTPTVLFSQQPNKTPPGRPLLGKLEKKVGQFEASNTPLSILMTKKSIPAPLETTAQDKAKLGPLSVGSSKKGQDKIVKRRGSMSLLGGKKHFRYGKNKKLDEEQEKDKQREQVMNASTQLQTLAPSRAQQLRHEKVSLHVFVRALDYQERHDIIVFTVEKQSVQAASTVETLIRQVKARAEAIATQLIENSPRGDEEINAKRFCSLFPSDDRGGGGFLLMSLLQKARDNFQQIEGSLGGAMRQFLTGAQATARDIQSNAEELSALFGTANEASPTPPTALLRVTLVACGMKRESAVALNQTDLLKEYLRMHAGRTLLQLDPTDKKVWGAVGRARALIRTFNEAIHSLEPRQVAGDKPCGMKEAASLALHSLLDLLLAQSAVVRYLKHLETEMTRERKQLYDNPATVLQCYIRQTQARMELKKRRREFRAALAIQCAFRQHLARRRVLFLRWTRAAIKVQRAYRRKRQRAKGSRPQKFTAQLLSASQNYGTLGRSPSVVATMDEAWRTDMSTFGSFQEYLASKGGREQLRKEEELMWKHRRELEKDRARLARDEALREDVGDLFELLDDAGSGELSRERTTALITRLHVPLNEEEVADVVAMMDSDGSGGISMDEFMRWFVHEFPLLQKRAPRVCGVVTKRDWQWVIEQSARSVILKRWRAMRAGATAT
ncbi:EF-hand domain pair [Phytophthora infestans]|uniref:EF-hand domain pair n=1 Tax=Phytophthora infestans TaxID=4787 RepID=A0A833WL50_PHYIN|nr:EF-hand domain pair [Phytophthora infestans]